MKTKIFFRAYKLRFSCFTSCLKKEKTDELRLCVTPVAPDHTIDLSRSYSIPLIVSANPGRDSGLFIGQPGLIKGFAGTKRPARPGSASGLSGIPIKREPTTSRAGSSGNFLTPDAHRMLENVSDCKKNEINFRIGKLIETELDICNKSGPS